MLYASLVFEKEPLVWAQFPDLLNLWLQNTGGIAAIGIFIVALASFLQRGGGPKIWSMPKSLGFLTTLLPFVMLAVGACYAIVILCAIAEMMGVAGVQRFLPRTNPNAPYTIGDWLLSVSGTIAICIALTPITIDLLTRISFGRIWAIARLSWKEAIRGRLLWVFAAIPLVFLFADWFATGNPKDQIKINVMIAYWSMGPLFLLCSGLLGSFSIPNDVKDNSIHTIVTKPVEKYEIVLGRFLGFAGLLSAGMIVVACLSLIYVIRGVTEEAAPESYKARIVSYGKLHFAGTKDALRADSVGREWGYRSYITGPTHRQRDTFRQYAIWDFHNVPSSLGRGGTPVKLEYSFDIFRLSKGEEGKGMFVTFTFADGFRQSDELDRLAERITQDREKLTTEANKNRERSIAAATDEKGRTDAEAEYVANLAAIDMTLLKEHGIYQRKGLEVADYHTQDFTVPAEVVAVLLQRHEDIQANAAKNGIVVDKTRLGDTPPPLRVFMSVDLSNEQQMLGVARQDFYLLAGENWFWWNFLKGTVGIWCANMLVLGVAISCSTYLNNVINLLATYFVYGAGLCGVYMKEVAERKLDGGGPTQSLIRVVNHMPIAGKLDENAPTTTVVVAIDNFFSWWIARLVNLFPDVGRHDLHQYVANGFDIGWTNIILLDNILPTVGYLIPWAILAYYLMKFREIANPT